MIPFSRSPEPADFQEKVRAPGEAFLRSIPPGSRIKFQGREYWRASKEDLRQAFGHICAYTSIYVEEVTGADTVEHFISKHSQPNLAYEWSNFRFVCSRMNGRKGIKTDVIDPLLVTHDLFNLDFPSLLLLVNPQSPLAVIAQTTVKTLGLNDEKCINSRLRYARLYADNHVDEHYLSLHAPMIHRELVRQGIDQAALAAQFSA